LTFSYFLCGFQLFFILVFICLALSAANQDGNRGFVMGPKCIRPTRVGSVCPVYYLYVLGSFWYVVDSVFERQKKYFYSSAFLLCNGKQVSNLPRCWGVHFTVIRSALCNFVLVFFSS
jgi:hypothetical protein